MRCSCARRTNRTKEIIMEREFELKSFKISDAGAECRYRLTTTTDDGISTTVEQKTFDTRPVHPDLSDIFGQLADVVARIIDGDEAGCSKYNATGVTFAGKDENIGITVIADKDTPFGFVKIKTPRIKYNLGDTEVHARLTALADAIVAEAQAYMEGKSGELEVFE